MIRVQKIPQTDAIKMESREDNIIIAWLDDWFKWSVKREGMEPALDLVDFYTAPRVLCNFLNDSELENSAVAAFARLHWRDFAAGGLVVRLGSKEDQQTLRTEIKEYVLALIYNPDDLKIATVKNRLGQYYETRARFQLLQIDTNPVMDHLIDMSERNRGANKTGVTYDPNTMEVRSKKVLLGKKTVIATVGIQISGTLRDLMYGLLIKVLLDQGIEKIRCCKVCGRFTHDTTKPKSYCSDDCKDKFWSKNERRKSNRKNNRLNKHQEQQRAIEERAGRDLFMKLPQLLFTPQHTSREREFLMDVQRKLPREVSKTLSSKLDWKEQPPETRKALVRLAMII